MVDPSPTTRGFQMATMTSNEWKPQCRILCSHSHGRSEIEMAQAEMRSLIRQVGGYLAPRKPVLALADWHPQRAILAGADLVCALKTNTAAALHLTTQSSNPPNSPCSCSCSCAPPLPTSLTRFPPQELYMFSRDVDVQQATQLFSDLFTFLRSGTRVLLRGFACR